MQGRTLFVRPEMGQTQPNGDDRRKGVPTIRDPPVSGPTRPWHAGRMVEADTVSAVDVVVRGQVQGVGFRYSCVQQAARLGVVGWVANEPDGTVAGHFEGAPDAVRALVDWCRRGPAYAEVAAVDERPVEATGARTFSVR